MVESGIFYSAVLDPVLKQLRKKIARYIRPGDRVIDIACGTGAQLFELAEVAASVTGVDLSESMVRYASQTAKKKRLSNACFYRSEASDLSEFYGQQFDVAILSLALHQFNSDLWGPILMEIQKVSDKIIVLDYAVPLPENYVGVVCKLAEFMAGRKHHQNFKRYIHAGGLETILPENGYRVNTMQVIEKGAFCVVVAQNAI